MRCKYEIWQLKSYQDCEEAAFERFESIRGLAAIGKAPNRDHYEQVYFGEAEIGENIEEFLDAVFETFNINRPKDFQGHSLSVSDVVAVRQGEVVQYYFVDSFGFQRIWQN